MFNTSTQRKSWMFGGTEELERLRVSSNAKLSTSGKIPDDLLLSPRDELYLIRYNLVKLKKFCEKFKPWISVIATAFIYMKRFYLHQSCMEYHPKNIALTCAYLACKVDEYNISIDQFVKNIEKGSIIAQKTILSNELLLMKKMDFHLTVHLPYRAVEGFLIDLRARYPPAKDKTDLISKRAEEYLEKLMYTDACFLFTPSQIALAAVRHGADKVGIDLNNYLCDIIFADEPEGSLEYFTDVCNELKILIERDDIEKNSLGKETTKKIKKKLQEIMKAATQ